MKKIPSRTLIFDIETSAVQGWAYGKYEIDLIKIDKYQWVQSVAYKWLGENKVHVFGQDDFPQWKKDRFDDSGPIGKLHEALNQAEIVVGHNVKKFDIKKSNTRFLINHLDPPRPYKVVDTLSIARSKFGFTGNGLNDLAIQLGLGQKLEKSYKDLSFICMQGDPKAWKYLKKYNGHDVILTEKVYKLFLPWMDSFPVTYIENGTCRKCGSRDLIRRGFRYSKYGEAQSYKCSGCGSWSQDAFRKPE